MSTDKIDNETQPTPIEPRLSVRDLTEVLVKHYGLHNGCYDLLIEFQIGVGSVGPNPETQTPGAMIGLSKVGLVSSVTETPSTVNAAIVNPTKKSRKPAK